MSSSEMPSPDDSGHKSEANANENHQSKARKRIVFFPRSPSNLRAWCFGGIGTFLSGFGAFYYNNRHIPAALSILVFFSGTIFYAYCAAQVFLNYHSTLRNAKKGFWCIIISSIVLISIPVRFELIPQQSAEPEIDLQPGSSLDPTKPFSTRFILENPNSFELSNVNWYVSWKDGYDPHPKVAMGCINLSGPENISAHAKISIAICNLNDFQWPESIVMAITLSAGGQNQPPVGESKPAILR